MASINQDIAVLEEMMKEVEATNINGEDQILGRIKNETTFEQRVRDTKIWSESTQSPFPFLPYGQTVDFSVPLDFKGGAVYANGAGPNVPKWLLACNTSTNQVYVEALLTVSTWDVVLQNLDASTCTSSFVDPLTGFKAYAKIAHGKLVAKFTL